VLTAHSRIAPSGAETSVVLWADGGNRNVPPGSLNLLISLGTRLTGLLTSAKPAVVGSPYPVDAIGEAAVVLEVAGLAAEVVYRAT
jgi:hypothetical protein